ncbi:von Willebrand factor A domain-containing protein 2-like [Anneissia japonica]|uniref:von Willebrand factor A domain-containing protein 2-like n=1 Tax=Anneissia japonica TaxID=1529436 RepID=UPI0014255D9E|nr:von Willebrand factor A domain-containing protein 2-like [Anneissia japonica]
MLLLKIVCAFVFTMKMTGAATGSWEPWNSWSQCYETCGPSFRVRFRACAQEPCPSEDKREIESCQERESCEGPWTTESQPLANDLPAFNGENVVEADSDVDLVFLLDESISVSAHYVTLGKTFIRRFLDRSMESYDGNHIRFALCSFSSEFNVVFEYGELNQSEMDDAVEGVRYYGGSTDAAQAVDQLKAGVLTRARPGARSILVLLSDGFFEQDPVAPSGVEIFAVAIGDNVNDIILSRFSDGPMFYIQSNSDVTAAVNDLLSAM